MTKPTPHGQVPASSAVLKAIREANMQLVRTGDDTFVLVPYLQAHVQNPTEIEHVAGDVSKTGAKANTSAQQPAPATQQAGWKLDTDEVHGAAQNLYWGKQPLQDAFERGAHWGYRRGVSAAKEAAARAPADSVPAQVLVAALIAAKQAINSMKAEAETAAQGDEQMMLEACETISNEGLQADTAIRVALASHGQAPAQAAPAAVAGPSLQHIHDLLYTAQRTTGDAQAQAIAEARIALSDLMTTPEPVLATRAWPKVSGVSRDEGHPRALLVFFSAEPTDDEMRAVHGTLATTQPALQQEPSHTAVRLAELVLSDCGHSSNYTPLLDRVAARIDAHVEQRLDELRVCLESKLAPSPAVQGDALDAVRLDDSSGARRGAGWH